MPPPKRRTGGRPTEHRGRVTVPVETGVLPRGPDSLRAARSRSTGPAAPPPPASSRYTPPIRVIRERPGWHRTVGWLLLAVGVAVAVLNDAMLLGGVPVVLPGGHSELYLLFGIALAAFSTRWFGWFDRTR